MKVTVDYDVCASTGSCMQVCPEVFEVRSDGFLYVLQEEPPRGAARPRSREAADLCPTGGDHRSRSTTAAAGASTTASPRPGRRRGRCCASGSTPIRPSFPDRSTARPTPSSASARRSSTPPPTSCARSSRSSPTSRRSAPSRRSRRVCRYIRERYPDVVLVLDAKRGDVGSTAEHYAREAFGRYAADAVTVNPYLGTDAAAPFLAAGGVLALCHTSNPGSAELQDLDVGGRAAVRAGRRRWSPTRWSELGEAGLVVGATYPGAAGRGPGDRRRPADPACPASAPRAATSQASVRAGSTGPRHRPAAQLVAGDPLRLARRRLRRGRPRRRARRRATRSTPPR